MIPNQVIVEMYDILCEFGEPPVATKETFFTFCESGWIFTIGFDCVTCGFDCEKPFNCSVKRSIRKPDKITDEKLQAMNDRFAKLSAKYQKTLAFW